MLMIFVTVLAAFGIVIVNGVISAGSLGAAERSTIVQQAASVQSPEGPTASSATTNVTRGTGTAKKFGLHEIELTGDASVLNPFETIATVTFIAPSGNAVTVDAFYDGGDTWRARLYVTEVGPWQWTSTASDDPNLHDKSGSFMAVNSDLRGMLRQHTQNPKQWMTDDGQSFINLSDTAYNFFNPEEPLWQDYVRDTVALGITSMRVDSLRAPSRWENYWEDSDKAHYRLENFQRMDARLQWLFDTYPQMHIQLKLLPAPTTYGTDDPTWNNLPPSVRNKTMRYMIARWAGYPNLFFEVTNDTRCSPAYPQNRAMAREVGPYFKQHDPWQHLMSYGPTREEPFCFTTSEDDWVSYIALETANALSADHVQMYRDVPLHVFNEEDYYEGSGLHRTPANPQYFYRRLFWSWLLSGGSPNYGGRYGVIHPYTQTGSLVWQLGEETISAQLVGLDSVPHILPYFTSRDIELWRFEPDDAAVSDLDSASELKAYAVDGLPRLFKALATIHEIRAYLTRWLSSTLKGTPFGSARPKAARRGYEEYLIYHPNAKPGEISGNGPTMRTSRQNADVDPDKVPRLRVNLRQSPGRTFRAEWFRVHDGIAQDGGLVAGGSRRDLVAPWKGYDVVLRLHAIDEDPRSR